MLTSEVLFFFALLKLNVILEKKKREKKKNLNQFPNPTKYRQRIKGNIQNWIHKMNKRKSGQRLNITKRQRKFQKYYCAEITQSKKTIAV